MKLIVGLGNPGLKYKKTRHNVGFLAVDYIQKKINNFSPWQLKEKLKAELSSSKDNSLILAKPQTFMNKSGEAVKKLVSSFKLQVSGLCVIHDDFDLPLSAFKFEKGRGSAGHKGVQSIINSLDTNVFWRLRIGIRPSGADTTIKAEDYVLKKFSKKEMEIINKTIQKAIAEHWPF